MIGERLEVALSTTKTIMQLQAERATRELVQAARLLATYDLHDLVTHGDRIVEEARNLMGNKNNLDVSVDLESRGSLEVVAYPEEDAERGYIFPASLLRDGVVRALFGPDATPDGRYVTYNSLYSASTYAQARALANLIRSRVFRKQPASIIDIGCNTGQNTRGFSDAGFVWVRAFDSSPVNVLIARANMRAAGVIPSKTVFSVDLGEFPAHPFDEDLPYGDTVVFLDPEWGGPGYKDGEIGIHLGDMGFGAIVDELLDRGFGGKIVCKIPRDLSIPPDLGGSVFDQRDKKSGRVVYSYWTDIPSLRSTRYISAKSFSYKKALAGLGELDRGGARDYRCVAADADI